MSVTATGPTLHNWNSKKSKMCYYFCSVWFGDV